MKNKLFNEEKIEGYVYSINSNNEWNSLSVREAGPNSKNPGEKYIAGELNVAVDEDGLNVITIHYTYVTPVYKKSGRANNTYTALKKIIDNPDRTWIEGGKENAFKVSCTGVSIAVNDFIAGDGSKVAALRNEGGFVSIVNEFSEERNKCNIIVVSGNVQLLYALCNTAQVYRVIHKPADLQYILQTIKEIQFRPTEINQKELKKLLTSLNFKVYANNVSYLITAINVAYEKPYLLNNMKDLYSVVASHHNISPITIKWSIRNSVGALNRSITIEEICSIFALKNRIDSITPKQFITLVVEYFEK